MGLLPLNIMDGILQLASSGFSSGVVTLFPDLPVYASRIRDCIEEPLYAPKLAAGIRS